MNSNPELAVAQCEPCQAQPQGDAGHAQLAVYVWGPFPGQTIYKCSTCDDRWIRHYGGAPGVHAWTRFADRFPDARRVVNQGKSRTLAS